MSGEVVDAIGFTPGPWVRIGTDIGTGDERLASAIGAYSPDKKKQETALANARLIVEAPAMYSVLRALVPSIEDVHKTQPRHVCEACDILSRIDGEAVPR